MNKQFIVHIFLDFLYVVLGFFITSMFVLKKSFFLSQGCLRECVFFFFTMLIVSLVKKKYRAYSTNDYYVFMLKHIKSWLFSVVITIVVFYLISYKVKSNQALLISFILVLIFQTGFSSIIYFFLNALSYADRIEKEHLHTIKTAIKTENCKKQQQPIENGSHEMYSRLSEELSDEVFAFVKEHSISTSHSILFLETINRFNVLQYQDSSFETIVNISFANDIRRINKFFESVNIKLNKYGIFIQCVETLKQRKRRFLKTYPPIISHILYLFDFAIHRIWPRLPYLKNAYFMIFKGKNRRLSYAETLGRLYSCGFEYLADKEINEITWFAVKKISTPALSYRVTYGPIIKLKRVGKNGKIIWVYKCRTMHPYSEYLQDYIYKLHNLASGGKFKNDFRVSTVGKVFRKFWIDELPMLVNFFKGELKFFGVRPLSEHYFALYPEDYRKRRLRYKPGLIPPYYVHLPKTLSQIIESEKKYLDMYDKYGFFADVAYTLKALFNIFFRKIRSS